MIQSEFTKEKKLHSRQLTKGNAEHFSSIQTNQTYQLLLSFINKTGLAVEYFGHSDTSCHWNTLPFCLNWY